MYNFVDAVETHKLHPETFKIPSEKHKKQIQPGDFVKVCHNGERFWTKIKDINESKIIAFVDNDLICPQPFKYGDIIEFEHRHIYNIICKGEEDEI